MSRTATITNITSRPFPGMSYVIRDRLRRRYIRVSTPAHRDLAILRPKLSHLIQLSGPNPELYAKMGSHNTKIKILTFQCGSENSTPRTSDGRFEWLGQSLKQFRRAKLGPLLEPGYKRNAGLVDAIMSGKDIETDKKMRTTSQPMSMKKSKHIGRPKGSKNKIHKVKPEVPVLTAPPAISEMTINVPEHAITEGPTLAPRLAESIAKDSQVVSEITLSVPKPITQEQKDKLEILQKVFDEQVRKLLETEATSAT